MTDTHSTEAFSLALQSLYGKSSKSLVLCRKRDNDSDGKRVCITSTNAIFDTLLRMSRTEYRPRSICILCATREQQIILGDAMMALKHFAANWTDVKIVTSTFGLAVAVMHDLLIVDVTHDEYDSIVVIRTSVNSYARQRRERCIFVTDPVHTVKQAKAGDEGASSLKTSLGKLVDRSMSSDSRKVLIWDVASNRQVDVAHAAKNKKKKGQSRVVSSTSQDSAIGMGEAVVAK